MNASARKKMTVAPVLALMVGGLGGCVAVKAETEAGSPLAPRVQALVDANRTYPRWADFPAAPQDLPQPIEVAARVNTLRATGGALAGEVSRLEWTLAEPDVFAAEVSSRVRAVPVSPDAVQSLAEIDAFAARLRQRAAPPPPIDRR